jgi:glycoprotein 6-alpha-L-fucosyltransferase
LFIKYQSDLHPIIRLLLASIRNLTDVDGYQSWREMEHESLSKLMQARLNALQNPSKPCTDVKRVSCNINKGCGYGCEIHHAMHCFHIAYALGRPMILHSGNEHRWKRIFSMKSV